MFSSASYFLFLCAGVVASSAQFQGSVVQVRLPPGHGASSSSSSRKTGASADTSNLPPQPVAAAIPLVVPPPSRQADSPPLPVSGPVIVDPAENEVGFVDSVFGEGTQSRIVASVNDWISEKAKTNPGCVERLVCETYRTGETMNGIPYLLMQITNAALSFMVAEMFDRTIDIQEITRAARYGRTMGTCGTMKCDFADGQLRTLGDYLDSIDEFFSSIFSSISDSIGNSIGKK